VKPFDVSKFRKNITKSIDGISVGFHDPKTWISTGNYALNYVISGNFNRGVPLGKTTILAGESGSGKSLLSANIIKNAQDQGIYVILVDSENALDEDWLKAFNVDTSESKLLKFNMAMIDDVAKMISEFVKEYRGLSEADRPEVLFVIDSLGMLMVPTQQDQFNAGSLRGDMGLKPKALKALITNCVNMFGDLGIGLLATNHTYASQSQYAPDDIISGGSGPIFAASIVVSIKKGKLKEDDDGNKTTDVHGIRSMCQVAKTRYSKPFEKIELKIPYAGGLDEYSGLLDLVDGAGLLVKEGNSLIYTLQNGEKLKYFRKAWNQNKNGCLDLIMADIQALEGGMFRHADTIQIDIEE